MTKAFIVIFILFCFINIYAVLADWQLGIYSTKPFLMTSLAIWFYLNTKGHFTIFAKCIIAGLIFSIAGDSLLMFVNKSPSFFLLGLGGFLITHLFYITAFVKYEKFQEGFIVKNKWMILPILTYLITFVIFLWPDLTSGFLIPVITYSCIISTMLILSINMRHRVSMTISNGLILGALLFVISDSFIAINKFKGGGIPSEYMGAIIMFTYLMGQYFIVKNTIYANEDLKKKI